MSVETITLVLVNVILICLAGAMRIILTQREALNNFRESQEKINQQYGLVLYGLIRDSEKEENHDNNK